MNVCVCVRESVRDCGRFIKPKIYKVCHLGHAGGWWIPFLTNDQLPCRVGKSVLSGSSHICWHEHTNIQSNWMHTVHSDILTTVTYNRHISHNTVDRGEGKTSLQMCHRISVCFEKPLIKLVWRNPWGNYFPTPLTILLNSGDYRDQDQGFDAQTTLWNHRQEAWIISKGSLCSRFPEGLSPVIYESKWIKQKFSPGSTKQTVCYF